MVFCGHVLEAYDTMLELQKQGRIRSVGVSNFGIQHLEAIRNSGRPLPSVNQIELHPWMQNVPIVNYCRQHGIALMAYSPLAKASVLNDPYLQRFASKYRRSPAQILLRWSLQNGFIAIPKTSHIHRLEENLNIFDFHLSDKDMARLSEYGRARSRGTGWDPTQNDWSQFGPVY
ncbi:unnamed protein product [Didymodactylos carnosus]|uniref:NADP-dependent oxidoreductase domain-containing protein n=1 Tax=Didymodactylos carnosus TaxID=1234261 RepID=A0A8S2FAT3_9BILA|nr:unnamed protein product [Didymodactylos carnosus]CAF4211503.1 unnamed protein product [Didymodactylos carnosus]